MAFSVTYPRNVDASVVRDVIERVVKVVYRNFALQRQRVIKFERTKGRAGCRIACRGGVQLVA